MELWLILILTGLAAGFVSGLLGVGGGIVITPVLHYLLDYTWADAVALSLFAMMVYAPIGIIRHRQKGAVDLRIGRWLILGGVAGVALGHWLLPHIAVLWLKVGFGALLGFAAYRLVARLRPLREKGIGAVALVIMGFAAGLVSRLLGVGGGILTVPVLVLLGVPVHLAVGSSLVPVFTNAVVASIVNLAFGLQVLNAIPLAVGAVVGAPLGVQAAHALPEVGLRRVVAAAMAVVGVVIIATSGAFG